MYMLSGGPFGGETHDFHGLTTLTLSGHVYDLRTYGGEVLAVFVGVV